MFGRLAQLSRLTVASLALALMLFAVNAAPTSAHSSIVEQGEDYAVTDSGHETGAVCDMEADGHFVSATWRDADGSTVAYTEDGGDSGCDDVNFRGTADTVVVCELSTGAFWCTDTHKV